MRAILVQFIIIFFISCGQADYTSDNTSDTTLKDSNQFDDASKDIEEVIDQEEESIRPLVTQFNSKEVYFELVTREINSKDTLPQQDSIQRHIRENYTDEEIAYIQNKNILLKPLSNIQLLSLYKEVNFGRKVIYGADDREPVIYDINNLIPVNEDDENPFMKDAKCVVAMISKANLTKNSAGDYIIRPKGLYKSIYNLCETERFVNEPVVAQCSGFSISKDKIVTAGHCVNKNNFRDFYFVFDFIVDSDGNYFKKYSANKVYEATEFIAGSEQNGEDFAVLKVDKPIPTFRIPRIDRNNVLSSDNLFHVIGSPCGIPLKLATNANLRNNTNPLFFTITSDTYGGNSGSPVFNSETHAITGILVRGEDDFRRMPLESGRCSISLVCPFNGCKGEDVSRISQVYNYIN